MKIFGISIIVLSALCSAADALSVRVHPGDFVYLSEEAPERDLYSVVVHTIAIFNNDTKPCTLESIQLEALRSGSPIVTLRIPQEQIDASAKRVSALAQQGVLKAYDFYFQTSRYLPEDIKFAPSRNLEPGSATLISTQSMLLPSKAEEISISANCNRPGNKPVVESTILKIKKHSSPNPYHFPLSGTVYVGAASSLSSHHRWVANEEFALDLAYLQGTGQTHTGDGTKLDQYFSVGKDVMAIGDGVVIEARSDVAESDSNLRQPGESIDIYEQRVRAQQDQLLAKGYKEPLGNYVIIRHANSEFSHYAHLRAGSVAVKANDSVKRGQVIGKLGHSGNSTEPHLHFQITDGADPMYSRGIPVTFRNITVEMLGYENRQLQTGWLVTTK